MKRFSSCAVVVLLLSGLPALAQTKAILLDDLSVLEGTVQEIDGVLRVTTADGAAKIVAARQIAHVAESRERLYDFVAGKVNTTTADGSLQLANWCEKVGMTDRALAHAKTAAALAPTNATAKKAVTRLEKAAAKPRVDAFANAMPAVEQALPQVPNLPADAGIAFAAKVQPVLLNQCGTCHAQKAHAGTFKLTRIAEGYVNPEATAANLKAAAGQLTRDNPPASPLLTYAVTAHGGQKVAAFADRQRPAFQHLEAWVVKVLPSTTVKGFVIATRPDPEPAVLPGAIVATSGQPVAAKPFAPTTAVTPPPVVASPPKAKPRDQFDPGRFNALPKKADG